MSAANYIKNRGIKKYIFFQCLRIVFVKDDFHCLFSQKKIRTEFIAYTGSDGLAFLQGLSSAKLQAIGI